MCVGRGGEIGRGGGGEGGHEISNMPCHIVLVTNTFTYGCVVCSLFLQEQLWSDKIRAASTWVQAICDFFKMVVK